jgi:hypothetical protein
MTCLAPASDRVHRLELGVRDVELLDRADTQNLSSNLTL